MAKLQMKRSRGFCGILTEFVEGRGIANKARRNADACGFHRRPTARRRRARTQRLQDATETPQIGGRIIADGGGRLARASPR
jgi:hypothetical protein